MAGGLVVPGVGDGEAPAWAEGLQGESLAGEAGGELQDHLRRPPVGLQLEDRGAQVEVQPHQVEVRRLEGCLQGLLRLPRLDRDAKLAVQDARGCVSVGMGVNAGREAEQDILSGPPLCRQALQELQLSQAVHYHGADALLQSHPKLFGALVVAVEVDLLRWELHPPGDGQLPPPRHHIQPQPLLLEETGQGGVEECLAGVGHLGGGVATAKLSQEGSAPLPQGHLVEDIERGAELPGQVGDIAAAQDQVPLGVDLGRVREYPRQRWVDHGALVCRFLRCIIECPGPPFNGTNLCPDDLPIE